MDILSGLWDAFAEKLVEVLPRSPFTEAINALSEVPYLGYLNWFFPVRGCLQVLGLWLSAYGLYLLYSIVMRWVKVIGD